MSKERKGFKGGFNISKDPIFRIFTIIILGTVLFQLLFNIITGGGNNMGDMGTSDMMGTASLDSLITGLLILLVKFLLIALVISMIIGVFIWMKKYLLKNMNLSHYMNQNPMAKSIIGVGAAIVGLLLLIYVFQYLVNPSMGYNTGMDNLNGTNMGGFSGTLGISGVLTFLIKILMYVFIITLIISLVAYFKKQIETGNFHLFNSMDIPVGKNTRGKDIIMPDDQDQSIKHQAPEQDTGNE